MSREDCCSWCFDRPWHPDPWDKCKKHDKFKKDIECKCCKSDVNLCTSVNIWQNGEANGGDGKGGDAYGGDTKGGNAAAASADSILSGGGASASASAGAPYNGVTATTDDVKGMADDVNVKTNDDKATDVDKAIKTKNLTPEVADALKSLLDLEVASTIAIGEAVARGGNATGGDTKGGDGTGGNGGTVCNSATVIVENVVVISCNENGLEPAISLGMNDRKVNINVDEDGNTFVNGQKMEEQQLENGTKVFVFRDSTEKKSETK